MTATHRQCLFRVTMPRSTMVVQGACQRQYMIAIMLPSMMEAPFIDSSLFSGNLNDTQRLSCHLSGLRTSPCQCNHSSSKSCINFHSTRVNAHTNDHRRRSNSNAIVRRRTQMPINSFSRTQWSIKVSLSVATHLHQQLAPVTHARSQGLSRVRIHLPIMLCMTSGFIPSLTRSS